MTSKLLLVACLVVSACGANPTPVEYSVKAQVNYDKGIKELDRRDWITASKYFSFITRLFPYSKYAVLAELRLADAQFGAEQYVEAMSAYRQFMKSHPTDELVANGYVSFRIGEAYGRSHCGH